MKDLKKEFLNVLLGSYSLYFFVSIFFIYATNSKSPIFSLSWIQTIILSYYILFLITSILNLYLLFKIKFKFAGIAQIIICFLVISNPIISILFGINFFDLNQYFAIIYWINFLLPLIELASFTSLIIQNKNRYKWLNLAAILLVIGDIAKFTFFIIMGEYDNLRLENNSLFYGMLLFYFLGMIIYVMFLINLRKNVKSDFLENEIIDE